MLELAEVKFLQHLPHDFLRHHLAGLRVDLRCPVGSGDELLELLVHHHGSRPVVGPHEVQKDAADVLNPLVDTGADVLQRHLRVGLEDHQSRGVVRLHVAHLRVCGAQALLGVSHGLVDERENLVAHLRRLKVVCHLRDGLSGLKSTDPDGLAHLIGPGGNQVRVIYRLGKRHQLEMSHSRGEHLVNENLVGDEPGHQGPSVVLVLLLLPVAPGNGIAGQAGVHVLVDDGCPCGLRHMDRGLDDTNGLPLRNRLSVGIQNTVLVDGLSLVIQHVLIDGVSLIVQLVYFLAGLGVQQHIQGLSVVVADDLCPSADAGEVLVLLVRLELALHHVGLGRIGLAGLIELLVLLEPLGLPAQVLHSVAAHDEDVGLRLHATVVGVAEHHVDAVHQLHLNLATVRTKSAAVGHGIRVIPEVGAVVTGDGAVEQGVPQAVVHLELLQQVVDLGVGEQRCVVVRVRHIAPVVVGQGFKP